MAASHEYGQILVPFKSKYPTLGRDEYPTAIWFVSGPDVKTRPFAFNKVGWLNCLSYSNTHIKLPPTAWLQHIQADKSAAELSWILIRLQSIRLSVVGSCKGKTMKNMLQDMIKIKVECLSNDQYYFLKTLWETKQPGLSCSRGAICQQSRLAVVGFVTELLWKRVSVPDAQKGTLYN